jgi:hypothetical protein
MQYGPQIIFVPMRPPPPLVVIWAKNGGFYIDEKSDNRINALEGVAWVQIISAGRCPPLAI